MPSVLILSSSLLLDRTLLFGDLIPTLARDCDVSIWAGSYSGAEGEQIWADIPARVASLPSVTPLPEIPQTMLRRLNEFAWDFAKPCESRTSMIKKVRDNASWRVRAMKFPGRVTAALGAETALENWLEGFLSRVDRSPEARRRLQSDPPDLVITTAPFFYLEPPIIMEAKKLGIPVAAFVSSWDNITTKNRMVIKYNSYLLWSPQMKRELRHFYPYTERDTVHVTGAPQYDVFFDRRFHQSRREFCQAQGLDAARPIVTYCLGSPNLLNEHFGALQFADRLAKGELGNAQLLVRLHPIQDYVAVAGAFAGRKDVVVQHTAKQGVPRHERTHDFSQMKDWVNTFRHADVVINTSSTVMMDAAVFDRPVVNLTFDPEPGEPNGEFIREITFRWDHLQPVLRSGGVTNVGSMDELVIATNRYLANPSLHAAERRAMAEFALGFIDGSSGLRLAGAIISELKSLQSEEPRHVTVARV